jgi:hypothetical protein
MDVSSWVYYGCSGWMFHLEFIMVVADVSSWVYYGCSGWMDAYCGFCGARFACDQDPELLPQNFVF